MGLDGLQFGVESGDSGRNLAPVQFQLGFAGTPQAHASARPSGATAGLSGQVGPGSGQARKAILVLGQFNLHDAFAGARVLGENVQNQCGPVNHLDVFGHRRFQDALLAGRQFRVENDNADAGLRDRFGQLGDLAFANQGGGVRGLHALTQACDHVNAGRVGQQLQLGQRILQRQSPGVRPEFDTDHNRPFPLRLGDDQPLLVPQGAVHPVVGHAAEVVDLGYGGCVAWRSHGFALRHAFRETARDAATDRVGASLFPKGLLIIDSARALGLNEVGLDRAIASKWGVLTGWASWLQRGSFGSSLRRTHHGRSNAFIPGRDLGHPGDPRVDRTNCTTCRTSWCCPCCLSSAVPTVSWPWPSSVSLTRLGCALSRAVARDPLARHAEAGLRAAGGDRVQGAFARTEGRSCPSTAQAAS